MKFIRFSQFELEQSGIGIFGFINNHGCLDNPTFRGMRASLMNSFTNLFALDLHGNARKKERTPDGDIDENVFDIQQGVAVELFYRLPNAVKNKCVVSHADLWGLRGEASQGGKYGWLANNSKSTTNWIALNPSPPFFLFVQQDVDLRNQYDSYWKLTDVIRYC